MNTPIPIFFLKWVKPLLFILMASVLPASAASFVLPVEAIEASAHMDSEEFREKYPGISLGGGYLGDYGYFIRYNHENLYYFFGPIDTMTDARVHYADLDRIVSEAVWKRPPLSSATIDIIEFSRQGLRNLGDGTGYDDEGRKTGSGSDEMGTGSEGTEEGADGQENGGDESGEGDEGDEEYYSQIAGLGNSREDQKGSSQQQAQSRQQQQGQRQQQQQAQRQQQGSGSGTPSMSPPQQQQQGGGPPGSPDQQQDGGGPPPPNFFEMLRRIFGGR